MTYEFLNARTSVFEISFLQSFFSRDIFFGYHTQIIYLKSIDASNAKDRMKIGLLEAEIRYFKVSFFTYF
jgi:hypothetical protein